MVNRAKKQSSLKVLGELEKEIMEIIWSQKTAKVRDVFEEIRKKRKIAYTTVMTIMDRLYEKKILKRRKKGKTYFYTANYGKNDFLKRTSQKIIDDLIKDFGEVAIAQFVNTLDQVDADKLKLLKQKIKANK